MGGAWPMVARRPAVQGCCETPAPQRLFLERTGLSPKEMARVARLRSVLAQLASDARADWADLANAFGYADQAHLIHEFQALTGKSPARYLGEADAVSRQVDATGFYPVRLLR